MKRLLALDFATKSHDGQLRKYTNEPYIVHPVHVAGLVCSIDNSDKTYCTALMHDVIEDCGVSTVDITELFGREIAMGVLTLSDMEVGNRATRKKLSRERLALAPAWVQNIKVCDLISNTSSIVTHDPDFAKVYLKEKELLLEVLTKADSRLILMARNQIKVSQHG